MNKSLNMLAVAVLTLAGSAAQAANWVEIAAPATSGFAVGDSTVSYALTGGAVASNVWVYAGANPAGSQSPSDIASLVEAQYALPSSGAGALTLSSQNDELSGGKSGSFTVTSSFTYLAIHYGKGELLFQFAAPVAANTVFSFAGLPNGVSNYRAYTGGVSAVPEPATYGMLLGGLALVGGLARRRRQA